MDFLVRTTVDSNTYTSQADFDRDVHDLGAELRKMGVKCPKMGIGQNVVVPPTVPPTDGRPDGVTGNVDTIIDDAIKKLVSTPGRTPLQYVLVLLCSAKPEIYNRIKNACDIKFVIHKTCVLASKAMGGRKSVLSQRSYEVEH
jgi:hypothetical protein